jgi:hypothetical protein
MWKESRWISSPICATLSGRLSPKQNPLFEFFHRNTGRNLCLKLAIGFSEVIGLQTEREKNGLFYFSQF